MRDQFWLFLHTQFFIEENPDKIHLLESGLPVNPADSDVFLNLPASVYEGYLHFYSLALPYRIIRIQPYARERYIGDACIDSFLFLWNCDLCSPEKLIPVPFADFFIFVYLFFPGWPYCSFHHVHPPHPFHSKSRDNAVYSHYRIYENSLQQS